MAGIGLVLAWLMTPFALAQTAPAKPSTADFSREPIIIETQKTSVHFEADGTGSKTVQTRILVQTEAGVRQFGQVVLSYNSDFERLAIKGRVVKPDGTRVEIPASAVQDMSSPISQFAPMYSDIRQKHIVVPSLRPGDILEYELQFDQFAPLEPNHFWWAYDFNRSVIVRSEELRVDLPTTKYVNVKTRPEFKPQVSEADGRRVYQWKTAHLEAGEDAPASGKQRKPKKEPESPAVQISTFKNWGEVGDWYAKLERDRRLPSEAIAAKVKEITQGAAGDLEKLRAIYEYVAQNYRYVSLSFGLGRYQPHAAAEVFGNQYGDCKDKHTLLAAMGEAAGLHLRAALTSATHKVDADFPSPQQFDHVISFVRLGDEEIWLDTTTELAPFRMLLAPVRKKESLVVAGEGRSELRRTPADPAIPNTMATTIEGTLSDLGTLEADVRLTFRGDLEVLGRLGVRAIPQSKWKEMLEYMASSAGIEGEISDPEFSSVTDTSKPLEYRFHIIKLNYFNTFGKDAAFPLPFSQLQLVDPDDIAEGEPITLGSVHLEYHLKLQVPRQFEMHLPLAVDLKRDYGQYASKYQIDGSTVTGERILGVQVEELPVARRGDFQAFRRAVIADTEQKVAVKVKEGAASGDVKGGKSDELLEAADAAYQNREYRTSVNLLERLIKAEPAHKSAYNDLGRSYLKLLELDKAEAALKKAVELDPYSPYAYNNLGQVYSGRRRYDEAERAYRKQIEIVPLDEYAHRNLGMLLLDQEKFAEAEPELEKGASITPEDALLQMELGSVQMRLNKPEKAQESFGRAVELEPSPIVLNHVAAELAEKKLRLDQAKEYAESAVVSVTSVLRKARLEGLGREYLAMVELLAECWDTLGWVHFQAGETTSALRYLAAAWELSQKGLTADRLGQAYQRAGKRELALQYYAFAAAAFSPHPEGRKHLAALVGESKVQTNLNGIQEQLSNLRSYSVPGAQGDGDADFFVALVPGPKVAEVRFIRGDETLKPLGEALKKVAFKVEFPEPGDARIIRRGILACRKVQKPTESSCTFVLLRTGDVGSVN
jgi:tetratricopeptide (TPR) repeat protein